MAVMNTPNETNPVAEADEIEALLPWYATGTLSAADMQRVNRYLEAHPKIKAHTRLVQDERDAAIVGNEAITAPCPAMLDRLMASIAATAQPRQMTIPSPQSVWEKIAKALSSVAPRSLGFAAAAAAVALVVQTAAIGVLINRDRGAGYQTASGGATTPAGAGAYALISLHPNVSATSLTAALSELKMTIVDGPKAGGMYRVRTAADKADAAIALAKLKGRADVFAFVGMSP
jgi:hypothetical protein